MLIRPGTPDDADAAARVHVDSWGATTEQAGPSLEQRIEWHRRFPATFVADDGGTILGFVAVGPSRDADADGELYTIYVDPRHWRGGVGSRLIRAGEERMRELGYRRVVLWTFDDNPRSHRFYEAAGWSADGERRTVEFAGAPLPEVRYAKQL